MIGAQVFRRPPGYSPSEDNIVRAEVRLLRKRLESYFQSEGVSDPTVIRIPKGSYVPVFEPRFPQPETRGDRPGRAALGRNAGSWFGWQTAAILILAIACGWMWRESRSVPIQTSAASVARLSANPLWSSLFGSDRQTIVVCADSTLVVAETILHRPVSLDEYLAHKYATPTGRRAGEPDLLRGGLARWQFTDITDVHLVQRLYSLNADRWDNVSVRLAKIMRLQDFKNGNLILLGSTRSNPWSKLFEPLLDFSFEFDEQAHSPFIRNKAPLPGEREIYRAARPGGSGEAYGTIALVPNLRHSGNVLIIAGTTGESTEATGEFLINEATSSSLMHALMKKNKGRLPYFEVLLRSGALAGVAKNPEVILTRILPGEVVRN